MVATTPNRPAPIRLPVFVAQEKAAAEDEGPDWGAARCLIGATATAAIVGVPLGLLLGYWAGTGQMAAVPWAGLVQAHGQAQLFGWIGLAVLGVTFHAMAHLFRSQAPPARLTWAVLALQLLGVALRVASPLAPWRAGGGAPGAWLALGSALAFLAAFGVTLEAHLSTLPRRAPGSRAPKVLPFYLLAGLALWTLALLVNLDAAVEALRQGTISAGALDATSDALVVALSTGGLALFAAGMSLRVVVGWLDLPAPDLRRAQLAWTPLASGALLRGLAPGLEAISPGLGNLFGALGAALWAGGILYYAPALRGLWAPGAVTTGGGTRGEADPPLAWFIRVAHGWLIASGLLAVMEAALRALALRGVASEMGITSAGVVDAGRHALLFGFLGMLTAGLSGRLPTAFLDVGEAGMYASRLAYRGAFWLLLISTLCRVTAALLGGAARAATLVTAGTAGALGLLCLLLALGQITQVVRRATRAVA